jgi:hypothetical protein
VIHYPVRSGRRNLNGAMWLLAPMGTKGPGRLFLDRRPTRPATDAPLGVLAAARAGCIALK